MQKGQNPGYLFLVPSFCPTWTWIFHTSFHLREKIQVVLSLDQLTYLRVVLFKKEFLVPLLCNMWDICIAYVLCNMWDKHL